MNIRVMGQLLLFLVLFGSPLAACDEEKGDDDLNADINIEVDEDANEGEAEEFASSEGRFSVTFPNGEAAPQEQVVPVPTEIGNIDMHMFLVDAGTEAYMAAYADYPAELVAEGDPQTMLDMGRDGAISNVNGELLKENDFKLQGYPAKEFYARGEQGGQDVYMRANIIMADERLYQVLYLTFDEGELDSQAADDYVASFRIDDDPVDDRAETEEAEEIESR
jgi:hypothetical protein